MRLPDFQTWCCDEDARAVSESAPSFCAQEEEKNKIQNDLRILTERLSRINESLARKVSAHSTGDLFDASLEHHFALRLTSALHRTSPPS